MIQRWPKITLPAGAIITQYPAIDVDESGELIATFTFEWRGDIYYCTVKVEHES